MKKAIKDLIIQQRKSEAQIRIQKMYKAMDGMPITDEVTGATPGNYWPEGLIGTYSLPAYEDFHLAADDMITYLNHLKSTFGK